MNEQPLTIPISLTDVGRVLLARQFLVFAIFALVVVVGTLVTLQMPPRYQSTMKILITSDRLDPQVSSSDKTNDMLRGELTEEDFNSELEILQSRAVLEATARQLGLDNPSVDAEKPGKFGEWYRAWHKQAPASSFERAVTHMSESLEAVPIKKSRIVQVTYQDESPERAAQVLQTLYQKYAEHHLRMNQNQKAAEVFRTQSDEFNRKLKAATDALKRFDLAHGFAGSPAQRELLLQQFYMLQQQLNSTRTEKLETQQRLTTLKSQLAVTPERIESEVRTKYTGARDRIKDEILVLEMQSAQLRQKYQSTHRLVKETEERLAQARKLLEREEQTPPQEKATMPNDIHRRLTTDSMTAQSNLAALNEREQRLATLTKQYHAQIATFDVKSLERTELERTRSIQEEAYLLYSKKAQEAEISNVMNQAQIANISLAQPATINHKPVSPKPLLNVAVLAVVGLLAGIATVLTLERDRLLQRQQVSKGVFPINNGHIGIALARLRQREHQLLLETTDTPRSSSGNRPAPSEVKSLTLLRHKLQRQRSGNAST
jgi:polysaccharide biosynthesis protein PslE